VAELATSGMTNRDTAAALFISPKTVEANRPRVYHKLDIHLLVIDPAFLKPVNTLTVGGFPSGVAVSPAGDYAGDVYVTNQYGGTVSVIS
jgi:DNA-binding beta-propeller fold protein YncE